MAYSAEQRIRAQRLYVDRGLSFAEVAAAMGVAKTTLLRWSERYGWQRLRELRRELQQQTVELAVELARQATESRDPQHAYAARVAAEMAGLEPRPQERGPTPIQVAEILLDELVRTPEVGDCVRKRRREVLRVVRRVLEGIAPPPAVASA